MFARKVSRAQANATELTPGRALSQRSAFSSRAQNGNWTEQAADWTSNRIQTMPGSSWDFSKVPPSPKDRPAAQLYSWPTVGGNGNEFRGKQEQDSFSTSLSFGSGGTAREVPHRAEMESAFGEDFSNVRALTGQRAALDRFGAEAAASGEDVVFATDRPSKQLVGHELAHVVQQRRWRPASGGLSSSRDTQSERDAVHAGMMAAQGSRAIIGAAPAGAIAFSPKNPFDDPAAWATPAGAANAIKLYQALSKPDRQAAVAASYNKDLVRVLRTLSTNDQVHTFVDTLREIALQVEKEETRAYAGRNDDQIADLQAKFIVKQAVATAKAAADAAAKAKGVKAVPPTPAEIEQARKDAVAAAAIPNAVGDWWGGLAPAEKANWIKRGNAAIAAVVAYAKVKHPELGITAASFKLDFPAIQKRGANVVAAGSPAQVGMAFTISAELNPAYVIDVVVHEVFGHPEYGVYGQEYHLGLYKTATKSVPGYKKPAANSDEERKELDSYAYQETEIYAVLRSMGYRTAPTKADAPNVPNLDTQGLVTWHVGLMGQIWSPTLIIAVLRGLRKRLVIDPRISAKALNVFDKAVETNFGVKTRASVAQ